MILVTGGSGWLGSELVEQLLKQDKQVRVLITDENNRIKQLKEEYKENLEILIGNICNIEDIKKALKDIDEVYHLAAKVHSIPKNKEDEELFYKVNRDATEQIFNECIIKKVKKVIFFSTVSVYGNPEEIITTKTDKNPINAYGKSKMEAENIANIMYKEKGLPIIIIEPVTVYGEGDVGNFKKIENLAKKGFTVKFGNGENKKTIIYYKDLVQMVLNISKEDSNIGKTFICGTETISINNINKALKERYKKVLNIWIPKFITNIMSAFSRILRLNGINRKITALTSNNELKCSSILDNFTSYKEYYSNKNKVQKRVLFVATLTAHIKAFHIPYLKMFKEQGYEVHVASKGTEKIGYCDKHYDIQFERFPIKPNNIKAYKELKNVINENGYEIIHCHTPVGGTLTRLAAKKARKNGTRVIYTAHGFHFFKGASKLNWLIYYPIEKILSKHTDDLITINSEDYELAKKKFGKCKNIHYTNGVGFNSDRLDIEMSEEDKVQFRKELGINKDDVVLSYVAELNKNKNQILLIETVKKLKETIPNIKLLLIGEGSSRQEFEKAIKEQQLEENVKLLGRRQDIGKLLKITDIYTASSLREGTPLNIMEAMYIGLPIVAIENRGHKELIEDGKNGFLINSKNKNDIYTRIIYILKEKKIQIKIKKENIKEVKKYEIEKVKEETKKIYGGITVKNKIGLIIPNCTDFNRGDQALVFETARIMKESFENLEIHMMSEGESIQCQKEGLQVFTDILKHPSRFNKKNKNVSYNAVLKIKWGFVAVFDLIVSKLLLSNITRRIGKIFLNAEQKRALKLFEDSEVCFVKGGGFLHDYSGGLVGLYTVYYQLFHIMLAQKLKKPVYIMPNSFGPFKNKKSAKLVNKVIDKCELVTARESISADGTKNQLGRDLPLYPDVAFFLQTNNEFNVDEYFKSKDIEIDKKYVAVTVRPYRFSGYDNPHKRYMDYKLNMKKFILWLNEKGYTPLLVVHTRAENDHENDYSCIQEIADMIEDKELFRILKDDNLSCREIKKIYSKCKYIIGTRFHSVIFSITQQVPAISITYGGNKGDGIMKDSSSDKYAIKISELEFENLKNIFEDLEKNKNESIESINKYLEKANKERTNLIEKIKETYNKK